MADVTPHINALADPNRPAEAETPEASPPHLVELFDPANPTAPRMDLVANFDPHAHVRWDHRPAIAEIDLSAVSHDGQALLDDGAAGQLRTAGLVNLKAILAAGRDGIKAAGLRGKVVDDLHAWAMGRHAAVFALAEIAAELAAKAETEPPPPETPPAPKPAVAVPAVTRPTPPAPPAETGKDEKGAD